MCQFLYLLFLFTYLFTIKHTKAYILFSKGNLVNNLLVYGGKNKLFRRTSYKTIQFIGFINKHTHIIHFLSVLSV